MDHYLSRVNTMVKNYDRDLFALKDGAGTVQVWRKGKRIHDSMVPDDVLIEEIREPNPQFIFAVTNDFTLAGQPVEWGIEPLRHELRRQDSWNRETIYQDMVKRREREAEEKERQQKSDFYDRAKDMRRQFARNLDSI